KEKRKDTIKFRVTPVKRDASLKDLFMDSSFVLDYAYSLKTGEKYIVAISGDNRFRYPTKLVSERLYFLPTYSGAVVISEKGEFLKIANETQVRLVDQEDKFFAKAASNFSRNALERFFFKTGIDLIEKQLRDYSKFNRDIANFKASGDYKDALDRLNNAIKLASKADFLKVKHSEGLLNAGLESIIIEENSVEDLSGIDDGLFEVEKTAKKELNQRKDDSKDVLVPEFASEKLKFLTEKLRMTSIKKTSSFQKEKVTIKRIQIQAFKEFYHEILDLSKLLKSDISGEFPRSNKGLALYTLANAQLNRCRNIISLPEVSGSVYTQDIRLWKAVCLVKTKEYSGAYNLFKANYKRINTYPAHLKNQLIYNYAIALQGVDNYKESTKILKKLEQQVQEPLKSNVQYYLGMSYLFENESELAEKMFKSLVFSKNKEVKYKSRLEYLSLLLYKKEVNKGTILKALEELRFDFRGGDVELESSKVLASLYLQEDYLKEAMELYKYISIYFPRTPSAKDATETLFNIFFNLFTKKQKTNSNLGTVSRLALFYDFIELTPSEYEGNQLISNVVSDLIDLGLYDNAIKLLNIQLNYKTKDEDIAQNLGEILANLYLKTGQLKNANKTLTLTQKEKKYLDYTDKAKLIKSKVFIQMNDTKNATKLLNSFEDNIKAKYILADIYRGENNYPAIIDTLESIFLGKKVKLDEEAIVNLSYLMVSYALTGNVEKLNQVKDLYLPELKKVDLEYKVDFLLKLAGDDIKIKKDDSKLLGVWQKVIRIDNNVLDFIIEYEDSVNFRKALNSRDYNQLRTKYKNRLN
ncbi:MAG TPA: hypothetical protein DCL21_00345, partial [Alphaproteobacteria bacterium]|nr:hypothetical protein [Alphaproteobacteria bacterium]